MIFYYKKVRIHIHLLFILFLICSIVFSSLSWFSAAVLCLMWHEAGHILAAKLLHIPVAEIEFTPWGGVMTLKDKETNKFSKAILSFSGPFMSLIGYAVCYFILHYKISCFNFMLNSLRFHLLLFLVNLLPVLPLDGGQAILSLLGNRPKVYRILNFFSYAVSFFLIFLSVYAAGKGKLLMSPAFIGCGLMYAAETARKSALGYFIHVIMDQKQKMEKKCILPVKCLAAADFTNAFELIRYFSPLQKTMIFVFDSLGREAGILHDESVCTALLKKSDATLSDILQTHDLQK